MQGRRFDWRTVLTLLSLSMLAAPDARAIDTCVSPGEHDDRRHLMREKYTSVWGSLEEAADYYHNHVFSSLEADRSRTYVVEAAYTLQYALDKYPRDVDRVESLLSKGQLAVSGNCIAYSSNNHEQETVVRFVTYAKWYQNWRSHERGGRSNVGFGLGGQPFSKWEQIFKDAMTTAAAIDRLVHHSIILELNVSSYRLEKARRNDGESSKTSNKEKK